MIPVKELIHIWERIDFKKMGKWLSYLLGSLQRPHQRDSLTIVILLGEFTHSNNSHQRCRDLLNTLFSGKGQKYRWGEKEKKPCRLDSETRERQEDKEAEQSLSMLFKREKVREWDLALLVHSPSALMSQGWDPARTRGKKHNPGVSHGWQESNYFGLLR